MPAIRCRFAFVLLLGLLLTSTAVPAAELRPSCGPYHLAFYELGVLFKRDTAGQFSGIDKDLVDELGRRSGCRFETVVESRVRIWDQLAKQTLDLSVSGIASPEREQFAEFVPYFQTRNFAVMRTELAARLPTLDAFASDSQRMVAVVKSFKHGPVYDAFLGRLRAEKRVIEMADFDGVVKVFKAGRADLMLVLPTSWVAMVRKDQMLEQLAMLDWAPHERVPHGLIISRQRVNEADKQRLRQGIQSMLADGSMDAILRQHLGDPLARSMRLDSTVPGP